MLTGCPLGVSFGVPLGNSENTLRVTLRLYWDHVVCTMRSLWGYSRFTLGVLWDHFGVILGKVFNHLGDLGYLESFWF